MNKLRRNLVSKCLIQCQAVAFIFVILIIWLDEVIDIPHMLLGAEKTPINWRESIFETIIISILALTVIRTTARLIQRMKYLEGTLAVCSSCKKIRDDKGEWRSIESYVSGRSEAVFSHGICPECAERLYPDYNPYKQQPGPD